MFTLNLVSLFTLFTQWDSIPSTTKLNVLNKLASSYPDLVLQAFKDLQEPQAQEILTQEREIMEYLKADQVISAIKAFRMWTGGSLKESKDVIDYVRSGTGLHMVCYEYEGAAIKLRDLYTA